MSILSAKLTQDGTAFIVILDDGSIVPGSKITGAQLKTAVKAKM